MFAIKSNFNVNADFILSENISDSGVELVVNCYSYSIADGDTHLWVLDQSSNKKLIRIPNKKLLAYIVPEKIDELLELPGFLESLRMTFPNDSFTIVEKRLFSTNSMVLVISCIFEESINYIICRKKFFRSKTCKFIDNNPHLLLSKGLDLGQWFKITVNGDVGVAESISPVHLEQKLYPTVLFVDLDKEEKNFTVLCQKLHHPETLKLYQIPLKDHSSIYSIIRRCQPVVIASLNLNSEIDILSEYYKENRNFIWIDMKKGIDNWSCFRNMDRLCKKYSIDYTNKSNVEKFLLIFEQLQLFEKINSSFDTILKNKINSCSDDYIFDRIEKNSSYTGLTHIYDDEVIPGIYNNVTVIEFHSFYTSIIENYNICFSTIASNDEPDENCYIITLHDSEETYRFLKREIKEGILPSLIHSFKNKQKEYREQSNNIKEHCVKEMINCIYGKLQFLNIPNVYYIINTIAYSLKNTVKESLKTKYNAVVISEDIDSIFVTNINGDLGDLELLPNNKLESYQIPSMMLFHRRKYIKMDHSGSISTRGFLIKTCPFIEKLFNDITTTILTGEIRQVYSMIYNKIKELINRNISLQDLTFKEILSDHYVSEYHHLKKFCEYHPELGYKVNDDIEYVVTNIDSVHLYDKMRSPVNVDISTIDLKYYRKRMDTVLSVILSILPYHNDNILKKILKTLNLDDMRMIIEYNEY